MTTNVNTDLKSELRGASYLGRKRWHSRKRLQMFGHPGYYRNNDTDSLVLLGAVAREAQERKRKERKT